MSASKPPGKRDNSSPELKATLRERMLKDLKEPHVLDCFCGNGEMWRRVYQGRAAEYVGLDREKVHSRKLCLLMDNRQYVGAHDISRFNVIDLDAYGCPWALVYRVLERAGAGPLALFVTDGLIESLNRKSMPSHIVSATQRIPKSMPIPAPGRWYVAMFKTMLLDAGGRYGWRVTRGLHGFNSGKTVCYWGLRLERHKGSPKQM